MSARKDSNFSINYSSAGADTETVPLVAENVMPCPLAGNRDRRDCCQVHGLALGTIGVDHEIKEGYHGLVASFLAISTASLQVLSASMP